MLQRHKAGTTDVIGTVTVRGAATSGKGGARVKQATTMLIAPIAALIARRAAQRNTIADVLARNERARRLRSVFDRRTSPCWPPR